MEQYAQQIQHQLIKDISVTKADLDRGFADLVVNEQMVEQLGPAMNSGRSILLYGPPGNGKSSLAMGMRTALDDMIFVPTTLEYNNNIISLYDPLVHGSPKEFTEDASALRRQTHRFDPRYVLCKRPTVITGGELRLEMLELKYNAVSKTYEAPLQLKSTGGIFIVDDLGRQVDSPQAMINRWITPMETSFDILTLATGEKMTVPFDTLVVFSTNFHPNKLFDKAALRRIYYKLLIDAPSRDETLEIWVRYAQAKGIPLTEDFLVYLFTEKYKEIDNEYAAFHAAFLISHMRSLCEYRGLEDQCTPELLDEAWKHLRVEDTEVEH
jgi:predicted ATPase with chaperone activity